MRVIQPDDVVKPASNYAQAVAHKVAGERLVVSGQIGVAPDGTIEKGLEAQLERTWSNLLAVVRAAGFRREEIVKVTIFVTVPGAVAASPSWPRTWNAEGS